MVSTLFKTMTTTIHNKLIKSEQFEDINQKNHHFNEYIENKNLTSKSVSNFLKTYNFY